MSNTPYMNYDGLAVFPRFTYYTDATPAELSDDFLGKFAECLCKNWVAIDWEARERLGETKAQQLRHAVYAKYKKLRLRDFFSTEDGHKKFTERYRAPASGSPAERYADLEERHSKLSKYANAIMEEAATVKYEIDVQELKRKVVSSSMEEGPVLHGIGLYNHNEPVLAAVPDNHNTPQHQTPHHSQSSSYAQVPAEGSSRHYRQTYSIGHQTSNSNRTTIQRAQYLLSGKLSLRCARRTGKTHGAVNAAW